jgi:ABC-type polysaccharide/polyol phosphate transport system ATPase subunit
LDRSFSGLVRIGGRLSPFIELGVGFNPEFSARTNIEINGMLMGLTRRQVAERFDSILAFSGLERFVDQQLKNYSSGMLLRLAYSVAIQVPFDVLLVDEALAVGDAEFQQKCLDTFDDMRSAGKTVVLVSHDLGAIESLCDQALLLRHGMIEAIGDPTEVIDVYQAREAVGV